MNIDQKIGQLFTVWVMTKNGDDKIEHISKLIKDYHLDGLIFPLEILKIKHKQLINFKKYQKFPY
jgi:hypothetical protein